jgi:AcrR family transcriptional regulator
MDSLMDQFSLREINFAKTRLKILQVILDRVKEKDFEEITVDEICKYAEISRGTFFNYFATKNHIFQYYQRIWDVRIGLTAKQDWFLKKSWLEKIRYIYDIVIK